MRYAYNLILSALSYALAKKKKYHYILPAPSKGILQYN